MRPPMPRAFSKRSHSQPWARQAGCSFANQYCVGELAYNISRSSREVTIVGIQLDGRMVVRFSDNGGIGGGWSRGDLARTQGCSQSDGYCVGEEALNISREYRKVQVVGVQDIGALVVRFVDTGAVGGGWRAQDLARLQGCGQGNLCVGTRAYNVSRGSRIVAIVAIQHDGRFVVRFEDSGAVGGGWSLSDLAVISYGPYPPAPIPNPPNPLFACELMSDNGLLAKATSTFLDEARSKVYERCVERSGAPYCRVERISCRRVQ